MVNKQDESHSKSGLAPPESWRERLYTIIFEADTPAGKLFDVLLLVAILLSVLVVMMESVQKYRLQHEELLRRAEWFFTILFTVEYAVRILCARRPLRYIFSFYGMIDLLAILPSYLLLLPIEAKGTQRLATIRAVRLLRAFRIFKLAHMLSEAGALRQAVWASRAKVAVFLSFVVISVVIVGSAMHLIEGPPSGFSSIPRSMYWAVVTLTTVGYGDITPVTVPGQILAAIMMIFGYSLIIVPTGIVTAELVQGIAPAEITTQICPECMQEGHDRDAVHCKYCGAEL